MSIASLEDVATQMGQISKLVRLLASSGITSEHLQLAIDSKSARASLVEHLKQNCPVTDYTQPVPKAKLRKPKQSNKTFDEAAFFQTRPGLWVDSDLPRFVGLKNGVSFGASALKHRLLEANASEADMFGKLGTDKHKETLKNACDLGQIGELIAAQEGGTSGTLLSSGNANIFAVRGKDGALHVVSVYWDPDDREWYVYCDPFDPGLVWYAGSQVFSN